MSEPVDTKSAICLNCAQPIVYREYGIWGVINGWVHSWSREPECRRQPVAEPAPGSEHGIPES